MIKATARPLANLPCRNEAVLMELVGGRLLAACGSCRGSSNSAFSRVRCRGTWSRGGGQVVMPPSPPMCNLKLVRDALSQPRGVGRSFATLRTSGPVRQRAGGENYQRLAPPSPQASIVEPVGAPSHHRVRPALLRFLNPWVDLANVTRDDVLANKVEVVTRTFGVVAALMCSLSAAALAVTYTSEKGQADKSMRSRGVSVGGDDKSVKNDSKSDGTKEGAALVEPQRSRGGAGKSGGTSIIEHIAYTKHLSGTSLLVSWGVPRDRLRDSYMGCCAGSFYASVCAMGLSAVVNAWLAATPAGGTRHFVRYHSLVICSIPGLLALSTGLAGCAVFIGLDQSVGVPISYIGLVGTAVGGLLIGTATVRGMVCTYRLLSPLVKKL